LTLAFALSKSPDIGVDVYEAASKFTEVGAGIGLWWRTRQVLKALDLEEDIARLLTFTPSEDRGKLDSIVMEGSPEALSVPSMHQRKADQPEGCAIGATFSRGLTFSFRLRLLILNLSFINNIQAGLSVFIVQIFMLLC
jgi:salicylate hydroxylase